MLLPVSAAVPVLVTVRLYCSSLPAATSPLPTRSSVTWIFGVPSSAIGSGSGCASSRRAKPPRDNIISSASAAAIILLPGP